MKKEVRMIRTDDVAAVTPYQSAVKGYRARRLVTKEKVNSEKLMVGIVEIEPNAKGYRWSYTEAEATMKSTMSSKERSGYIMTIVLSMPKKGMRSSSQQDWSIGWTTGYPDRQD